MDENEFKNNVITNTTRDLIKIMESIDWLHENSCTEEEKRFYFSFNVTLKSMANALCDLLEQNLSAQNDIPVSEEIVSYIKEIQEEIRRKKEQ